MIALAVAVLLITAAVIADSVVHGADAGRIAVIALLLAGGLLLAATGAAATSVGRLVLRPERAGPTEVLWEGTCHARFALPTFLVAEVAAVLLGVFYSGPLGVVIALAGMQSLSVVEIRLQVTDDALWVRYWGPLRWPAARFPFSKVTSVEVVDVAPLRYGGWGYRGSLRLFRRAALNLRRGPGLRLGLRGTRTFVVTVDDPEPAAALIRSRIGC